MYQKLIFTIVIFTQFLLTQPNNLFSLKEFSIKGNQQLSDLQVSELINIKINDKISSSVVESGIDNLLHWYEENGYPLATIEVNKLEIDSVKNELLLSLIISEGKLILLNDILVEGNKTTKGNIIKREAEIIPFEIYRQSKIKTIKSRIEKMQLFSSVEEPSIQLSDSTAILKIKVQEGNYNSFDGIAGYVPSADGKGTITGLMHISFKNIAGTGRKLYIDWEKENQLSHNYLIKYSEPWVLSFPIDLNLSIRQRKHENLFVLFSYDINGAYKLIENIIATGTYFRSEVTPQEGILNLSNSNESLIGGSISFDSRNNSRNYRKGIFFSTKLLSGNKKNKINDSSETIKITKSNIHLENIFSLTEESGLYNYLSFNSVIASKLEISDRIPLGGTTTLRGYREYEFYGTTTSFLQTEFRYYTGMTSQLYGFFDCGTFWNKNLPNSQLHYGNEKKLLYGYGGGVRLQISSWLYSFTIGYAQKDKLTDGKLHIGLLNEF